MAPTGQVRIQVAQLVHFSGVINAFIAIIVIASWGQIEIQPPHARHFLMSTFALGLPI